MPDSQARRYHDTQKAKSRQDSTPHVNHDPTETTAGMDGLQHPLQEMLGSDFSQSAFENHAALLGDSRMSHPMYARQRALLVQRIQRDYGNSYVQRLVNHIMRTRSEAVQTKLTVGPAGDRYEKEADQIAEQVVRQSQRPDQVQDQEPSVQKKSTDSLTSVGAEGGDAGPDVDRAIQKAKSGGQSLPDNVRTSMESGFGADFSGVRIHTGSDAHELNRSLSARAFTTGQDIFIGEGDYNPGSSSGKELLAHELTHVVQQNSGVLRQVEVASIQRASLNDYGDGTDPQNDPAKISDSNIASTDEFKQLESKYGDVRKAKHPYTRPELLLACRLIVRHMQEGKSFDVTKNGEQFLSSARKQLGTLGAVEKLGGDLKGGDSVEWVQQAVGLLRTEFGRWLLAGGPEPDPKSGTMNCWEVVLFGAYQAGHLSRGWIEVFYKKFNKQLLEAAAKNKVMDVKLYETELRASKEYTFDETDPDSPEPLPGDVVIFNVSLSHTAISLGTKTGTGEHEILSLWNTPNNAKYLQKTTIEVLLGEGASDPVKFWSPKWGR